MVETTRMAALRVTLTGGASITIPFIGPFSAGWAVNETQAGPFISFPMAPSPFLVGTLEGLNNFLSSNLGTNLVDPARLSLWRELNGDGVNLQFQFAWAGNAGIQLGSIEQLNSFRDENGNLSFQVHPDAVASLGLHGVRLEMVLSDNGSITTGGQIVIGAGLGGSFGVAPNATLAVPLFGENGYLSAEIPMASRLWLAGRLLHDGVKRLANPRCFLAGTPILMADGQEKPIEDIRPGDLVMSFDPSADQGRGALVPKPVSRTFQNITRSIIDLRGLHMTPGHVCLTDDGRFETIAEILLRDGILVEADGTRIRARTGAKIGSMEDIPVLIAYPDEKTGKEILVRARAGIPCCLVRERDGTMRHVSLALMLRTYHQTLTPDGLILSPDGSLGDATDWPEDSTPMDEDYRRNWVIQTADGKPYVPEWILEVASEAREEQTVGATLQRIVSPPSQRFTPKVVDNPTPPARNRAERRAQKHRGPL